MKLNVHTTGTGSRTAVVIHGISADAALFADFTDRLAQDYGYTVLAVDLRGHGESPRADDYPLAAFSDDVVESVPAGAEVVIGHSLGGRVLLDAVERLLPARAVYLDPAFAIEHRVDSSDRSNVGQHSDGSLYTAEDFAPFLPAWGEANIARVMHAHERWDDSMYEQLMAAVADAPHPSAPPVVPSLVVKSGDSPLVSDATVERLRGLGWEVRIQAGAGHNLQLESVEDTLRSLDGWI
ncbi:MAG TPA: alpha/beta fold hydrolase [Gryllotalpicola sp.]